MTSVAGQAQYVSAMRVEDPSDLDEAEDLASAWLQAHERIVVRKGLCA